MRDRLFDAIFDEMKVLLLKPENESIGGIGDRCRNEYQRCIDVEPGRRLFAMIPAWRRQLWIILAHRPAEVRPTHTREDRSASNGETGKAKPQNRTPVQDRSLREIHL